MDELVKSLLKMRKQPSVRRGNYPWVKEPEQYSYAVIRAQEEKEKEVQQAKAAREKAAREAMREADAMDV
jgi:hypothetical protein